MDGFPKGLLWGRRDPKGAFKESKGLLDDPKGVLKTPLGSLRIRQEALRIPTESFRIPNEFFGILKGSFGIHKGSFRMLSGSFGILMGSFGSPKNQRKCTLPSAAEFQRFSRSGHLFRALGKDVRTGKIAGTRPLKVRYISVDFLGIQRSPSGSQRSHSAS